MSAQKLIVAQLLLLFILSNINGVLSIKRSSNHSLSNQTDSTFKDRDGRQYGMSGYGPGFPGNKGASLLLPYLHFNSYLLIY